jgi:hypothetical protein
MDIPLGYYDTMYHDQDANARTLLTTRFFSLENLEYLNQRIGEETSKLVGSTVIVIPNNEFFGYLETTLRGLSNLIEVDQALAIINNQIIEHEVGVQYRSIRQRELFFKWFIFKDYPRTISRPFSTQGRHRDIRPTSVEYQTQDPKNRFFNDWLSKQHLTN